MFIVHCLQGRSAWEEVARKGSNQFHLPILLRWELSQSAASFGRSLLD